MRLMEAYRISKEEGLNGVYYMGVYYELNKMTLKLAGDNIIPLMFVTPEEQISLPMYALRSDEFEAAERAPYNS